MAYSPFFTPATPKRNVKKRGWLMFHRRIHLTTGGVGFFLLFLVGETSKKGVKWHSPARWVELNVKPGQDEQRSMKFQVHLTISY